MKCLKFLPLIRQSSRHLSTRPSNGKNPIRICVVGSGPAGFYTTHHIVQGNPNIRIDIYEKLPVPFGLVRYGVAPDHPEIKNVITSFTKVAKGDHVTFVGNVNVGKDVTFTDLRNAYHAVVLCYGSSEERKLGIPNENLVMPANRIVGWYNGVEEDAHLAVDLDVEEVSIIGHGNVALDVSRIFLMPLDRLKSTDISSHAYEALCKSRIKKVYVIGRRGPRQISFTIKELREVINLHGCHSILAKEDFAPYSDIIPTLPRPQKRIMELMVSAAEKKPHFDVENLRKWQLIFKRSPLEIITNKTTNKIEKLKLGINRLKEENGVVKAEPTGETEELPCQMVVRSLGYKGLSIDHDIPFDKRLGIIPNIQGKVKNINGAYCTGWIKTGPIGVIASTVNDSFETAQSVLQDIKNNVLSIDSPKPGKSAIDDMLKKKGVSSVSFEEWEKIDQFEIEKGKQLGKCREKVISTKEMLKIAKS